MHPSYKDKSVHKMTRRAVQEYGMVYARSGARLLEFA